MCIKAIAGSGSVGGHIIDYLLSEKKQHVVVLSRNEQPQLTKRGAEVRVVDYDNLETLKAALKGVHTVISSLGLVAESTTINLIDASEAAGVKRFIPSEYAADVQQHPLILPLYSFKVGPREILAKSPLEYTLVCNGVFMDYLLPKGAKKYFKDVGIPVSVPDRKADIPGDGEALLTLTTGDDIGHGIGELLHAPDGTWDRCTYIEGETTTWNKIVQTAEAVTGTKFAVKYRPLEQINKDIEDATGDQMKHFYAGVDLIYAKGYLALPRRSKVVDTFHYTTTEELLKRTYGKRE